MKSKLSKIYFFLFSLILATILIIPIDGIFGGWYQWLPGTMSRVRDAEAVAISAVSYGKWLGYGSYYSVNKALLDEGLNVNPQDSSLPSYFIVMERPDLLKKGLDRASRLSNPEAEGIYFSQDENGFALLYIAAFKIFGVSTSSWFWLYLIIYASSIIVACITFRKNPPILMFILVLSIANSALAHLMPSLPKDDVLLIHGSRFLGVMSAVAMFHIMFLFLYRFRPSSFIVLGAFFQVFIIFLVINARTSAAWIPLSIALLWLILWFLYLKKAILKPISWPIFLIALGFIALIANQKLLQNQGFKENNLSTGHVFWHNVLTSIHNNPSRSLQYRIPNEFVIYDDQVSYLLFQREISRRGESESNYLMNNKDWPFRTTSPSLDFQWDKYDAVIKDIIIDTVMTNPIYVINSILIQQPKSTFAILFGPNFFFSYFILLTILISVIVLSLIELYFPKSKMNSSFILAISCALAGSLLPVLCAAVFQVRLIEVFYITLASIILLGSYTVSRIIEYFHVKRYK